jgi:glucose/arabinose dehydrogenase
MRRISWVVVGFAVAASVAAAVALSGSAPTRIIAPGVPGSVSLVSNVTTASAESAAASVPARTTYAVPTGTTKTLVTGLAAPWQVVFLPDGQALVDERDSGQIKQISKTYKVSTLAVVGQRPPCTKFCEGGTLGMAIARDHAPAGAAATSQPYAGWSLFVFYTTQSDNRVVKYNLARSTAGQWSLSDQKVVVKGIERSAHTTTHNGGRLEIGPDGKLWVGLGDAGMKAFTSQSWARLAGSVLRVNLDGSVPADNPTKGSLIYSKGHRDTQGLAWDDFGNLWATEFGEDTWDEVNLVQAKKNYGWPVAEGKNYFLTSTPVAESKYTSPAVVYHPKDGACSGMNYVKGSLFLACLRGGQVKVIPVLGDKKLGAPQEFFKGKFGRLRQIIPAPDGSLWLLTSNKDGRGGWSSGGGSKDDDRIIRVVVKEVPLPKK